MGTRKCKYAIGGHEFPTKQAAVEHVRGILARHAPGQVLQGDDLHFVRDLLSRHPRAAEKVGPGAAAICVEINTTWRPRPMFVIERVDGSRTDFGFMKCIYRPSPKADLLAACRTAVVADVLAFKRRYFDEHADGRNRVRCALTGHLRGWEEVHVDHAAPWTFRLIVNRFCLREGIDPARTEILGFGDGESIVNGREEGEVSEERLLAGVIAASLTDLVVEREQVVALRDLARKVYEQGAESKFDKLREVLTDPRFVGEKFIVFTEHRDTLDYLIQRLGGMGYTGQIAQIHGGMYYTERQEHVERFRLPNDDGGARFMVCTDAAAEGINLQFCWIMVNFDVPWNPARLEQRMGRIHRYGQKHDPVQIINLVAPKTREGKVIETLLIKLETIRDSLGSEKVFDSIGRLFEGVSLKVYMEQAITDGADAVTHDLEGRLTPEQVDAIAAQEKMLYGDGGDVKRQLPRLRDDLQQEAYCRLLPGYVRHYVESAAPLVNIEIDSDMDDCFAMQPAHKGAVDPLLHTLEMYPARQRDCLTVIRPGPDQKNTRIWVHPGEAVFERFRAIVSDRLGDQALRGAVFIDPTTEKPYLFHLALISVVRQADAELPDLATEETLDCQLVGVKQFEGAEVTLCPVEHLLLLKGGHGLPAAAQRLAITAGKLKDQAEAFMTERVARQLAIQRRKALLDTLPEREQFIRRGFDFQEAELAAARVKQSEKSRSGNAAAIKALKEIKVQQRSLAQRRDTALATIRREPELIAPGHLTFLAHAIVVPSAYPEDLERHDAEVEKVAMDLARAFEEAAGATVKDVHTPELARAAGLTDNPGFDLLSIYPDGRRRAIEVKGRANTGDVEVSSNEWSAACNHREGYWLYAVYDCGTPAPRLVRVRDPFGNLLAKTKGSLLISTAQIVAAGEASE